MHITVYFDERTLHITDSRPKDIEDAWLNATTIHKELSKGENLQPYITRLQQQEADHITLITPDVPDIFKQFATHFTPVIAAGGLVKNPKNEYLLIHRRGKWDLPKGKMEAGEDPESCALREVAEETGFDQLSLQQLLHITYHTYPEKGQYMLKTTYWYLMHTTGEALLTPQTEEDIDQVLWVPEASLKQYMNDTYASVKEVLRIVENG